MSRTFLTAEWRYLAMLNYEVDPAVLTRFVPPGTELDFFQGNCFISIVGFQFLKTRVFGLAIPFHRNFEEVNLRFYVRRTTSEGWRRGVVFIRELVPRRAIAFVARQFYGEPYLALPMRHAINCTSESISVNYEWLRNGSWESVRALAVGRPQTIEPGSLEEFITEHYWGYTARKTTRSEYQVEHPRWQVWHASEATLDADVATLYGKAFAERLAKKPKSAFIADGSSVIVRQGSNLPTLKP